MADPRIGVVTIEVDGQWDIEDLLRLSEGLSETYGLFYPIVATDDEVTTRLHNELKQKFWSGEIETRRLGRHLYRSIPKSDSLKVKSFHYSSLGALELSGILSVLLMISLVTRSWIKTGDSFIDLWDKVGKFFEKHKDLKKPKKKTAVDDNLAMTADEARKLMFDVGSALGFDTLSCERLIEILGNPISALKFLVAVGNEAQKIAVLQEHGLLKLPSPSGNAISLPPTKKSARTFTYTGVEVVKKKPRRPTKLLR